ncbi:ABC transporter permease, partial [Acidobacteriota bacterium]
SYPLDYFFLDTSFENMHLEDKRMGEVFTVFSLLAIIVASLGLLGLASFTAEQKTKEIGIRKVMGASAGRIYASLASEFLKWVIAGNIIAWPLAYFAMQKWLQNFVYQTSIDIWIFIFSGLLTAVFSLAIVSVQSLKASQRNPVESLRYN